MNVTIQQCANHYTYILCLVEKMSRMLRMCLVVVSRIKELLVYILCLPMQIGY